jgi:hypothetical protein
MSESKDLDRAVTRRSAIALVMAYCASVYVPKGEESKEESVRDLCWGKDKGGKEVYLPCGKPRAVSPPTWLVLDLDDLHGIQVRSNGKSIDIIADEIWMALGGT